MSALTTSDRVYQVTEARQVTGAAAEPEATQDAVAVAGDGAGAADDLAETEPEELPEPVDELGPADEPDDEGAAARFSLGQWLILGILIVLNAVVILIAVLALMGQLAI